MSDIYAIHALTGEHRKVVTASDHVLFDGTLEWRMVEADADGWIAHSGSPCPVPAGTPCKIRLSDGEEYVDELDIFGPEDWDWSKGGDQWIVAYRPVLDNDAKPPAWDGKGERPPPGTRCLKGFMEVLILAHADTGSSSGPAVVYQAVNYPTCIDWAVANVFSPIRSAEDKAVDAMADVLGQLPMNATSKSDLASHLYHAVREGRIPGWLIEEGDDGL